MLNDERAIFSKITSLSKEQVQSSIALKKQSLSNGELFLSFDIAIAEGTGNITCTYCIENSFFKSIDMDLNFGRPAGYNNYEELKDVILHIINNI